MPRWDTNLPLRMLVEVPILKEGWLFAMAAVHGRMQGGVNELSHEEPLDSQIGPVFGDRTDRVLLTRCDGITRLGSVAGSQISNKALVTCGTTVWYTGSRIVAGLPPAKSTEGPNNG